MDLLDAMVYLLVFCIAVLFPLAGWLWEYVRPWARELRRDWKSFRKMRRVERKIKQYLQWREARECLNK